MIALILIHVYKSSFLPCIKYNLIYVKPAMMDILVPNVHFDVAIRAMGGRVNSYAIVQKTSAIVQLDVKVV